MWRTIYKCVIYTLVVILLFLVLLPFVLYIPAVQQGMANYATRAASEQMGMQIELERVRVRFPLDRGRWRGYARSGDCAKERDHR